MSLFEEGAAEARPRVQCSVCNFIQSKPDEPGTGNDRYSKQEWIDYLASDEASTIVYRLMRRYGYAGAYDDPIRKHRSGHIVKARSR